MAATNRPGKPVASVKVGNLEGDLRGAVLRFSPDFVGFLSAMGNSEQYILYNLTDTPYLLQTSKSLCGPEPKYGYNLIASIVSRHPEQHGQILDAFGDIIGAQLREAPPFLEQRFAHDPVYAVIQESFFLAAERRGKNWKATFEEFGRGL